MSLSAGIRAGRAFVEIGANSAPLEAALARVKGRLQSFGASLTAVGAGLGGVSLGVLGALAWPLQLAAKLETTSAAFETMLGSGQAAQAMLAKLQQFGAETPFEFPEIADAAKKLLAFGSEADSVTGELRMLGDIGSAVGVPLGEIAEIYGKARVQGRLFAEDINQLTGRGIPIIQALAKQFGVADGDVRKLVEDGKIGFPQLLKAFQEMTSQGGQFAGGMEKQSKTLLGQWSTLKDNIALAVLPIGQQLLPHVVKLVQYVGQVVQFGSAALGPWMQFAPLVAGAAVAVGALGAALTGVGMASIGLGALAGLLGTLVAKLGAVGVVAGVGATALKSLQQLFGVVFVDAGKLTSIMAGPFESISENWLSLTNHMKETWKGFSEALQAGNVEAAVNVAFAGVMVAWQKTMLAMKKAWLKTTEGLTYKVDLGVGAVGDAGDWFMKWLTKSVPGSAWMTGGFTDFDLRRQGRAEVIAEDQADRQEVDNAEIKAAEQKLFEAQSQFNDALKSAGQAAWEFKNKQELPGKDGQKPTPEAAAAQQKASNMLGQFNASLAGQQLAQKAQDRTARATEMTARNTARMLDQMAQGGGILVG
jgi:tape measure domain-containing protein